MVKILEGHKVPNQFEMQVKIIALFLNLVQAILILDQKKFKNVLLFGTKLSCFAVEYGGHNFGLFLFSLNSP